MLEDLEKEFYVKMREVEDMRKKGIHSKAEAVLVRQKEAELLKLEEEMECVFTVEGTDDE